MYVGAYGRKIPPRTHFSWEYFFQNKANLFPGVLNYLYLFDLGNQSVLGAVVYKGRMWAFEIMWFQ